MRLGNYAPGNYACHCIDCDTGFVGDNLATQCYDCASDRAVAEIKRLTAEIERMDEALRPSASTKCEYMGEFTFLEEAYDEEGEPTAQRRMVPWTTIKEIMAAIAARAARKEPT